MIVLVIDDSVSNAQLAKTVAETQGYQTIAVYNGDEGLKLALSMCPALIITELRFSNSAITGWEIIHQVRASSHCPNIPIIVAAVEIHLNDRARAHDAGCSLFLSKPYAIDSLRTAIKDLIGPAA